MVPYERYSQDDDDLSNQPTQNPPPRRRPQYSYDEINRNGGNFSFDDSAPPNRRPINKMRILIIVLHLTLIIGAIFLIYAIFISPFIFQDSSNFRLTGELSNFSTTLNQTLLLSVQTYSLDLDGRTRLEGTAETLTLVNFTGNLLLENNSMKLSGFSDKIQTRNSIINVEGQEIILEFERGGVELFLEEIQMEISRRLDISYSPDLVYSTRENTSIQIHNFSGTLSIDTLVGLYGRVDRFTIENEKTRIIFD